MKLASVLPWAALAVLATGCASSWIKPSIAADSRIYFDGVRLTQEADSQLGRDFVPYLESEFRRLIKIAGVIEFVSADDREKSDYTMVIHLLRLTLTTQPHESEPVEFDQYDSTTWAIALLTPRDPEAYELARALPHTHYSGIIPPAIERDPSGTVRVTPGRWTRLRKPGDPEVLKQLGSDIALYLAIELDFITPNSLTSAPSTK